MRFEKVIFGVILILAFSIRFIGLDSIPPGLYDDEVSIGYNAYSILHNGTDEYGISYPLYFKAFGEYKLPVYIYLDTLAIALFGKNAFAVRFPSAFFGGLTVFILYLFIKQLLSLDGSPKFLRFLPLLSSFFLAIIPWHFQFSRAAYEATVALFLYLLGCYLFTLYFKNKKTSLLFFSIISFTLTEYTYNAYRITTLLTLIVICFVLYKQKIFTKNRSLITAIFTLVLHLPIFLFSLSAEGVTRFNQTSAFEDYHNTFILLKPFVFAIVFIKNYLSYFSFSHLFQITDRNIRFYINSDFSLLFHFMLPLVIIGIVFFFKVKAVRLKYTVLGLFFLAPLSSALTISPHALRSFLMVIPLCIFIAYGCLMLTKLKPLF